MNIIWTIRELCTGENGFKNLFDGDKSYEKLIDLSDDKQDAILFAALLYGEARGALLELINDAYRHESYADKIKTALVGDGMTTAEAKRALDIFYEAFGFPGYRSSDPAKTDTLITDDGKFRTEYKGEVRNGKEHGVGTRTCYYNGEFSSCDECVWVDGVMCGYDNAREMEFGMFEDKKIGFVVDDAMIGTMRVLASSGEEFDDIGAKLEIE